LKGFGYDTSHMAKLYDISLGFGEYSLSKLSERFSDDMIKLKRRYIEYYKLNDNINSFESLKKISMNKLFSYKKKLKSGEDSKAT